ncbi:uncharacterized protein LOC132740925 [Ruditapes philippinarum]|uniref:uncharacterized protein LOC132740925 n=1 Tax=Ruditapes philippinarum TaxID=129788 RepID=UPI00295B1459|nr:uncharacterized protein LOC132740925 [Ruditapes philippinarum]
MKVSLIILTCLTTAWAFQFENCETSVLSTVYHWLNFDMYPLPVIFPGDLHMRVHLKILRTLSHPFIDTYLYKVDSLSGNVTEVPCIQGTYIGTCKNIDLCTLIDYRNNRTASTDTPSFEEQIDEILTTPLGRHNGCPILATPSIDKTVTIKLQPLSDLLRKILHGDYMLKLAVKDSTTSKGNIGCIKFNFTIVDAPIPPTTPTTPPTTTLSGPLPPPVG